MNPKSFEEFTPLLWYYCYFSIIFVYEEMHRVINTLIEIESELT